MTDCEHKSKQQNVKNLYTFRKLKEMINWTFEDKLLWTYI